MQPDAETFAAMIVSTVKAAQAGLVARVAVLEEQLKVATAEPKTATVQGERGLAGEKGEPGAAGVGVPGPAGKEGAGIASLVISAEGRLVAHLTDGRSVDAGPVPVKEGTPGRDADQATILRLDNEISSLRGGFVSLQVDLAQQKSAIPSLDDIVAKIPPAPAGKDADLEIVKNYVIAEVATIPRPRDGKDADLAEIAALVQTEVGKAVASLPVPKNGADGTSVSLEDVLPVVSALVTKAVSEIPTPKDGAPGAPGVDGASVSLDEVVPVIEAQVQKAVAALPRPVDGMTGAKGVDGTSVSVSDVAPLIQAEVQKAVATLPPAKDGEPGAAGRSVDVADVEPLILSTVAKAVAMIPAAKDGAPGERGKDGQSVTVEDVAPLVQVEVQKAVGAIPVPKDGVGVLGALIDRDGRLVVTLSDGTVKDLGVVVGRDVEMAEVARLIESEVANIPRPKDGKDGFGFDDLSVLHDGERGFTFQFSRGEQTKSFSFTIPCVIYRDLWTEGKSYEQGDAVTFGGCMWVAKEGTTTKPDFTPASTKFWRLAVKEGRKGRDADPAVLESLVNKAVAKLPKPKDPQKW